MELRNLALWFLILLLLLLICLFPEAAASQRLITVQIQ